MALSKEDLIAIDEKDNHPDKKVLCPHCGGEIVIDDYNCGYVIRCENNCIKNTYRGL